MEITIILLKILGGNVLHDNFIGHVVLKIKEPADGIFEPGRIFWQQWLCFERMLVLSDRTRERSGCYHDQDQDKQGAFSKFTSAPQSNKLGGVPWKMSNKFL
jgi:hypothetical protein